MNNNYYPNSEFRETARPIVLMSGASLVHEGHPDRNEDSFIVDPTVALMGAFDGVGGYKGSEEASRTAARVVQEQGQLLPNVATATDAEAMLGDALATAHQAILDLGHRKIGTTAAIAKVFHDEVGQPYVAVASVADARIYRYRQGELGFLSYDKGRQFNEASPKTINRQRNLAHVADTEDLLALSGTSQMAFRHRNIISSMMGQSDGMPTITTHSEPLQDGDVILTVSDGIHDNLTDTEIANILAEAGSPDEAVKQLTWAARLRSRDSSHLRAKPDDMTAVAMYYMCG